MNSHAEICESLDDAIVLLQGVAGPIALSELHRAKAFIEQQARRIAAQQAKIDSLMLEYCPDEMTPEQIATWDDSQIAALTEPAAGQEQLAKSACAMRMGHGSSERLSTVDGKPGETEANPAPSAATEPAPPEQKKAE